MKSHTRRSSLFSRCVLSALIAAACGLAYASPTEVAPLAISTSAMAILPDADQESKLIDYNFEVGNFRDLKVQDNVNVVYLHTNDTIGHAYYSATQDFENAFIFTNNNGCLKIQVNTEDLGKPGLPILYVSSNNLEKVENYSDYNLRIESNIAADTFSASLIGNGTIVIADLDATNLNAKITAGMGAIIVSGVCTNADFKLTGAGSIEADKLKTQNVNCNILGGGSISTYPLKTLTVKGIGSTRILYRGTPHIKHRGGGKLIPLD
ncbi:MAG: DUF2807 domain-containing protein [Muribaculaceae bacterium]|nr:DUF2807 domain-containing protein [Muribaculaceae bacterium]